MDPITLALMIGAGALMVGASRAELDRTAIDRTVALRPILQWTTHVANELLTPETLRQVGALLDLDLVSFWPKIESAQYKVVALTELGGPPLNHIAVLLSRDGNTWFASQCYRPGYRKVSHSADGQRISEVVAACNAVERPDGFKFVTGFRLGDKPYWVWKLNSIHATRLASLEMGVDIDDLVANQPWLHSWLVTDGRLPVSDPNSRVAVLATKLFPVGDEPYAVKHEIVAASGPNGSAMNPKLTSPIGFSINRGRLTRAASQRQREERYVQIASDNRMDEVLLGTWTHDDPSMIPDAVIATLAAIPDRTLRFSYIARVLSEARPAQAVRLVHSPGFIEIARQTAGPIRWALASGQREPRRLQAPPALGPVAEQIKDLTMKATTYDEAKTIIDPFLLPPHPLEEIRTVMQLGGDPEYMERVHLLKSMTGTAREFAPVP